jgi:hypothetical protein
MSTKKLGVSVSTWFCIKEQGMKDMEMLCKSSGFLVRSKNVKFSNKYHLLTASHAIAPWRYPKLYPDKKWMHSLNETHTYYTIETRHDDGVYKTQNELVPISYHHSSRDLAVLHLEDEKEAIEVIETFGFIANELSDRQLLQQEKIQFHGHEMALLNNRKNDDSNFGNFGDEAENLAGAPHDSHPSSNIQDSTIPIPQVVSGFFYTGSSKQMLAKTSPMLSYGMCGGPVIFSSGERKFDSKSGFTAEQQKTFKKSIEVCGLLEGIVPLDDVNKELRGLASFVDSSTIKEYVLSLH